MLISYRRGREANRAPFTIIGRPSNAGDRLDALNRYVRGDFTLSFWMTVLISESLLYSLYLLYTLYGGHLPLTAGCIPEGQSSLHPQSSVHRAAI
jgi:hypothetical protein